MGSRSKRLPKSSRHGNPAREEQLHELFTKYDTAKTGKIDFYTLVRHILPKDYPTKTWTAIRGEQMEAEEMRRLIEGKKNAIKAKYKPNMTLKRSPTPRRLKKIQHTARSGKGTARERQQTRQPGTRCPNERSGACAARNSSAKCREVKA